MAFDTSTAYVYFAGFFDGEGSCGIYTYKGKKTQFRVSLCNNDPRPLHRVVEMFGGYLRPRFRKYKDGISNNWEWYIDGTKAEKFLRAIRPHTIIKGEQIDVFLTARTFLCGKGRNKALRNDDGIASAAVTLKLLKRAQA